MLNLEYRTNSRSRIFSNTNYTKKLQCNCRLWVYGF